MSLTGAEYYFYCCPVVDPLLYHDLCWGQQLPGLFSHVSGKTHQFLWILAVAAGVAAAVGAVAAVLAVAVMPAAVAGAVEL